MKCKKIDCKYRGDFSQNEQFCDYIGWTGHSRACDPENCDKYEKKTKQREPLNILVSDNPENIKIYKENTKRRNT